MRSQRKSRSQKKSLSRKNSRKSARKQKGGRVTMPARYFNPKADVPRHYPANHEMLTKTYSSAYGPINAVNTTQPNKCGTEMGPNLAPFNPHVQGSSLQTGGAAYNKIVNPMTNRKVASNSTLGRKIIKQYINELSK